MLATAQHDGMTAMIKRVYKRELYNLILLYDATPNVLENKEVAWATRVLWIQPSDLKTEVLRVYPYKITVELISTCV